MLDNFKTRMAYRGKYIGEQMRNQTNTIIEATWMNSISTRPVQVKLVDSGLPPTYKSIEDYDDPIYAHFEPHAKYNVTGDEVDYYLTFRPGEMKQHPEIRTGCYVSIPDADEIPQWWLIMHIDDNNELKKCQMLKCNWTFRWVTDGKIYACLGCQRYAQSYNSGSWSGDRVDFTDNITASWVPTNRDTRSIGYNQRMIISDPERRPAIVWQVSKIEDTVPVGITKFRFTQENFDPLKDNADLGLADYYASEIIPEQSNENIDATRIIYSGTRPSIKIGGSYKTFSVVGSTPQSWTINDGLSIFSASTSEYIVEYIDQSMKLKVVHNYDLIGTVLTIRAQCADGSFCETKVEVIA